MNTLDLTKGLTGSKSLSNHLKIKIKIKINIDVDRVFRSLDASAETSGAGVVFIDKHNTVIKLRNPDMPCRINPLTIVLREVPRGDSAGSYARRVGREDVRESKLVGELVSAGLSCGAAVLSWVVVFGGSATVPITGGGSAAVAVVELAAAAASTAQCFIGMKRIAMEVANPGKLDWYDSHEWYANIVTALDIVSLAGVAATGATTIRMVKTLKSTTGKTVREVLKGLSRQQRLSLTREVYRLNYPNISRSLYKQMLRSGHVVRRFSQDDISKAVILQLTDVLGASLGVAGSAHSGTLNAIAVGTFEELAHEN